MSPPSERRYQIQYAVFFNHTTASSHSQSNRALSDALIPCRDVRKLRNRRGCWLSSSSTASLRLFCRTAAVSAPGIVLVVSVSGKRHEEHFISKLHFSWPQTSCASECGAKGSRVVLASYKDSKGQQFMRLNHEQQFCGIQKFAMRFWSLSDSQSFMNALKSLKNVKTLVAPRKNSESAFQSHEGCILMDDLHQSVDAGVNTGYPTSNGAQAMQPSSSNNPEFAFDKETSFSDVSNTQEGLLASFAVFLAKCRESQKEHLNVLQDADPLSSLVKSMPSTSFNAMLYGLEKVITDMEGDLSLQAS